MLPITYQIGFVGNKLTKQNGEVEKIRVANHLLDWICWKRLRILRKPLYIEVANHLLDWICWKQSQGFLLNSHSIQVANHLLDWICWKHAM